ncbi:hypothetical protein GCM10010508_19460 [Streptomyces naganishii JCM 4654]|uniref:Uncharacterized protein n=1 Tax=Streptomyces naganishii JCM 4654 TaxID=1306179 RepID=A0A918Y264_9ACTN|nr:hypothetical protein GCM10010508_19460 [Streptomyces naganishii JCM 4654]
MNLYLRTGPAPRARSAASTSGSDGFTYPLGPSGTKRRRPESVEPGADPELRDAPACGPEPAGETDPEQAPRSPEPAAMIEALSKVRRVYVCMTE